MSNNDSLLSFHNPSSYNQVANICCDQILTTNHKDLIQIPYVFM